MDDELVKKIQLRLEELPEMVQNAIQSNDLDARIQSIGKKHGLHFDQMDGLEEEIYIVMLGLADPTELTENIHKRISVDETKASAIAEDIISEIFNPIRDAMKEFAEGQSLLNSALGSRIISASSTPPQATPEIAPASKLPPLPSRDITQPVPTPPVVQTAPINKPAPVLPVTPTPPATSSSKPSAPTSAVPVPPAVPISPNLHPVDVMLTEKTVQVPPTAPDMSKNTGPQAAKPQPPEPQPYKKDPYREPIQ